MSAYRKSERISVWITPELKANIDQIVHRSRKDDRTYSISDFLRDAIRSFIDQQADVLGSRAFQVRTVGKHIDRLQEHINTLENRLALSQQVLLQLLAITASVQLEKLGQKVKPQQLIDVSIQSATSNDGRALLEYLNTLATDDNG